MRIGDIVNVKDLVNGGYWKGRITEIHKDGHEIIVQDKSINFAVIDVDNLALIGDEYWEQDVEEDKEV